MKWFGKIAYMNQVETEPGIWENQPIVHEYFGDLLKNYKTNQSGSTINTDISVSNQLSIVADPYLVDNFHHIEYVTFGGAKWKVSSVDVQWPRLILSLGSLYKDEEEPKEENEEEPTDEG